MLVITVVVSFIWLVAGTVEGGGEYDAVLQDMSRGRAWEKWENP